MALTLKRATKSQAKARIALVGPSGSGKTYTGLVLAKELAEDGRIIVLDTEHGSASKYADEFTFDVIELDTFNPRHYIEALKLAEAHDAAVVLVDSLSHAWAGKDGILEFVDQTAARSRSGSTFSEGWRAASPLHNQLVEYLLSVSTKRHLIVTMRSKMAYVIDTDEKGKQRPRKIGMQPVQREGVEYEFDIVGDLDLDNTLLISKTRCRTLNKAVIPLPGVELAQTIKAWLSDGAPVVSERPTADHIDGLIELATSLGIEREAFGDDMRRLMGTLAPMTRKYLLEHMTLEHYQQAWDAYQARLRAAIEQDLAEEDVPDPTPPQEATTETPAPPQDDASSQEHLPYTLEGDHATTGTPAYATAGQIAALETIAKGAKQLDAVRATLGAYPSRLEVPQAVVESLKAQIKAGDVIAAGDA